MVIMVYFLGMLCYDIFIISRFIVGFYFAFYLFSHALVIIDLCSFYQKGDKFIFNILFIWLIAAHLDESLVFSVFN